jgi:hypothetical protein
MMIKYPVIALSLTLSFNAYALDNAICTPALTVYFGNGMLSTHDDASLGMAVLATELNKVVKGTALEKNISYEIAHNPSISFVDDLLESAMQDMGLNDVQFWEFISGVVPWPQPVADALSEGSARYNASVIASNPASKEHVRLFNADLREGKKVVVVAHSQGNLFANIAYRGVDSEFKAAFGVVAVATPSDHVAGGGNYTTLDEDYIIDAVPGALWENFDNFEYFYNPDDISGHQFVASYFAVGRPAAPRIIDHVLAQYDNLEVSDEALQPGALTATLEWGSEPDVDLHVFEPNGSHVYYRQKQGLVGFLDRDDVLSYGPEHYTLPCENIEVGTYRIGVNYYEGEGPETARVTINTELAKETRTKLLSAVVGEAGDASPSIIYEVTISGDDEGYTYVIE